MTVLSWRKLPFRHTTEGDFYKQLNKWQSEVFYETLPAAGYEIREEQVYISYRITGALREKAALFAEAGSGTGKTFAYSLPALCYARLKGRPAVIACASAALQEQLVQPQGDIQTLSRLLGLGIDAILAKSPENYLCALQADLARISLPPHPMRRQLIKWLDITTTGDRAELPGIDDQLWAAVAYNSSMDCAYCRRRGYCHLARARQRLWADTDLIVCSHDIFFRDLWSRRRNRQKEVRLLELVRTKIPLLPDYSAVFFDEGHLVEAPALRHLGVQVKEKAVAQIVDTFASLPLVEEKLSLSLEKLAAANEDFFRRVRDEAIPVNPRQAELKPTSGLREKGQYFALVIGRAQEEMAMYQQYEVNQYLEELDACLWGLEGLTGPDYLAWWEEDPGDLWVLPQDFSQALGRELLAQEIPVIFTSATLDGEHDFAYLKRITGLNEALKARVETSFNLEKQRNVILVQGLASFQEKAERCGELLTENGGRALVLCASAPEVESVHAYFQEKEFPFPLLKEGDQDSSLLVQEFRRAEASVLIGADFWEGIDVPGPTLSLVIIFSLPFPPAEPLIRAKRQAAASEGLDPFWAVDFPAMCLKLRQGMGRLIRSKEDCGSVVILDCGQGKELRERVLREIGGKLGAKPFDKGC